MPIAPATGSDNLFTVQRKNRNLLLVDEGHRGAKTDEGAWFTRRSKLCSNGFTLEYSATFSQAVTGTKNEDDYAKSILFDYSYKWFYEDGFGKEYHILNLPKNVEKADKDDKDDPESLANYLTACLFPNGFDFAWISAIIHQHGIHETQKLFTKAFQALNSGGRVVVRDFMMNEQRTSPKDGTLFGINMLVATGTGMVYTYDEVMEALASAGFDDIKLAVPAETMSAIVTAKKP